MHPDFATVVGKLHGSFERLIAQPPYSNGQFPPEGLPKSGVYLFSEGAQHLYVGRSNNIRGRFGRHCNPGATHRMAAFAFRLARQKTGNLKATYKPGVGSRTGLMKDPAFVAAFKEAKNRIRAMDFRCVEETDAVRQCLLEVYCAIVLKTPYNDFDNH